MGRRQEGPTSFWLLEGFADDGGRLRRVPIVSLPFDVGRRPGLGLTLASDEVSLVHARFEAAAGSGLAVRDLGSKNGTFVNQRRLEGRVELSPGDLVQIGRHEFRVDRQAGSSPGQLLGRTVALPTQPGRRVEASRWILEVLERSAVATLLQPIVSLEDRRRLGFEVLGHGDTEATRGLPVPELFEAAAALGAEGELSRLLRQRAVEECRGRAELGIFFFNTHPAEVGSAELVESLRELRRRAPDLDTVLEVHESALGGPKVIRRLRRELGELGIGLAYDDFGVGQARLRELAESPPDYLKFDIDLIHGLDSASPSRSGMVRSLVAMATDLGIDCVAEGVETEGELAACREIGFRYGQGYLLGPPTPPDRVATGPGGPP